MKLLIVDDSNIMRRAIEKYVGDFNLEIIGTAGDGETGLEIFKRHRPELVTLDITMPRMDGLSCLKKIMEIAPSTLVIIISALKDPGTNLKAIKLGAKGFLFKPFTKEQLKEELSHILEGKI